MVINCLNLKQFRNYTQLDVKFHPKTNLFFGANGQGKTNLLESLYFLINLRSFRSQQSKSLLQTHTQFAELEAQLTLGQVENQIKIVLSEAGKTVALNNKAISKTSELVKKFGCLLFSADYIASFKSSPKVRRVALDRFNCLLNPSYLSEITQFKQTIRHKNHLLRQKKKKKLVCGTSFWLSKSLPLFI